ncbi:MAG: hypothetical protein QM762_07095 [Chryseolinea sp.]
MEQAFESTRNEEATKMMLQRRQNIAEEQKQEVQCREGRSTMKVAFRKSDEEERLVSILTKQIEE